MPVPDVDAPWHRLKRWHYLSATDAQHSLVVGVVHLGYVAQAFVHLIDRRDGGRMAFEALSPLGLALSVARGPAAGTTAWRSHGNHIEITADGRGWDVRLDVALGGKRLAGALRVPFGDGVSLTFDHGRQRAAYTYKVADVPCGADLQLAGTKVLSGELRGVADWTRAYALRHTRWHWASGSGTTGDGRRIGLNLSQHVYDLGGISQENTIWLDGQPQPLGAVTLAVPTRPGGDWQLRSPRDELALSFTPDGARRDAHDFGIVRSRFTQASGNFHGQVLGRPVVALYGVMEQHDALW